jgi:hypothetical protein
MPRKSSLTVVGPNDPAPDQPAERLTVAQAAATGDQRKLLVAMRERIAQAVAAADCPPRDLASLTRRLQDISKEIAAIDHRTKQEAREGGVAPDESIDAAAF